MLREAAVTPNTKRTQRVRGVWEVERNMCNAVMRGIVVPPGSRATSAQMDRVGTWGGLLSYGPDNADIFRRAAPYVDRILRGAKPSELPVQLPAGLAN